MRWTREVSKKVTKLYLTNEKMTDGLKQAILEVASNYPQKYFEPWLTQKTDITGIREIAARMSSSLSSGSFSKNIQIDDSERPKKVKYVTENEFQEHTQNEIDEDIEPLKRQDIINSAKDNMKILELYRI